MIPFLDLQKINAQYADEIKAACSRVIDSGWYICGSELAEFERKFATYCGVKHAVGVANGLDALILVLRAWKEAGSLKDGDEVIVPANTYIASILAITANRLTPVLVEPNPETFNLDPAKMQAVLTDKTKAVLPVHLYGQLADMPAICAFAKQHGLLVLEDAAQAHGAEANDKKVGAMRRVLVFIPAKISVRWATAAPSPPTTTNWHKCCAPCVITARTANTKTSTAAPTAAWTKFRLPSCRSNLLISIGKPNGAGKSPPAIFPKSATRVSCCRRYPHPKRTSGICLLSKATGAPHCRNICSKTASKPWCTTRLRRTNNRPTGT